MPEVSVIIPTYNHAHTIDRAISSALEQTLSDIECVVVDDYSEDDTAEVLAEFSDPRLNVIRHSKNLGGSAARNTGIDEASGSYIAFLDADDKWAADKLEKQVHELKSRDRDWGACYCGFEQKRGHFLVDLIDKRISRGSGMEGGEELLSHLLTRKLGIGGASTLLVRADVVNQLNGFDESFQRYQDIEFIVRLLKKWKLAYVDEPLVLKHDTGSASIDDSITAVEQFHTKFSQDLEKFGIQTSLRKRDDFMIAKLYIAHGEFMQGLAQLPGSRPPHIRDVLGLPLAVSRGMQKKMKSVKD